MPKAAQFFSPLGTAPWGRHNNPESTSGDLPTPMHCAGFATPELGIELADLTPQSSAL
jgi:hypothetical protein